MYILKVYPSNDWESVRMQGCKTYYSSAESHTGEVALVYQVLQWCSRNPLAQSLSTLAEGLFRAWYRMQWGLLDPPGELKAGFPGKVSTWHFLISQFSIFSSLTLCQAIDNPDTV